MGHADLLHRLLRLQRHFSHVEILLCRLGVVLQDRAQADQTPSDCTLSWKQNHVLVLNTLMERKNELNSTPIALMDCLITPML